MRIIAFAGRKQSGKSELASVCIENFENVSVFSFGNALKNLCAELLNITYDELNEIKNIPNKFSIAPDIRWIRIINKRTNIDEKSIITTLKEVITDSKLIDRIAEALIKRDNRIKRMRG